MPERLGEKLPVPLFERVAIIGIGLIGSSIAHAVRHKNLAGSIVAIDRDTDVTARVDALGLADAIFTDVAEGVKGCDLVILCVPVGACGPFAKQKIGRAHV